MRRKNYLDRMKQGDKLILFATKEAKILGFGEVTKEYYLDDAPVFLDKHDIFPDRIGFKSKKIEKAEEIDFKPLVWDLTFIKNPTYWGAHFVSGLCQIPEKDYEMLASKAPDGALA